MKESERERNCFYIPKNEIEKSDELFLNVTSRWKEQSRPETKKKKEEEDEEGEEGASLARKKEAATQKRDKSTGRLEPYED